MPLPNTDPSDPGDAAPLFADVDAVRGDHLRANNQLIWENLQYLDDGKNINDAAAATPGDADRLGFYQIAGTIIKYVTFANLWAFILAKIVSTGAGTPVGTYIQHAAATAPTGFLACDAAAVSRSTYADLFAVIGTTYGVGNGTTTFNLPDARGLVMVGAGANGTLTRADGSAYNGGTVGASRNDQMQGHRHSLSPATTPTIYSEGEAGSGNVARISIAQTVGDPTTDTTNGTPRTGNETRPAEIAVLVCIKY
jgi:microcystin-dependent protein